MEKISLKSYVAEMKASMASLRDFVTRNVNMVLVATGTAALIVASVGIGQILATL